MTMADDIKLLIHVQYTYSNHGSISYGFRVTDNDLSSPKGVLAALWW